jgi:2-polyprenyl-3-methyl-5-hydroxy-6-metoxy-1,4-benzoquinol methylase
MRDNSVLPLFRDLFFANARIFKKTFLDVESEFGPWWQETFDDYLHRFFGRDEGALVDAVHGYAGYAIDAMRLQQRFNRIRRYEPQSYEEACDRVYLNEDYMMRLYLPGILISHFLWRHHCRQLQYYQEQFLPLLESVEDKTFYEVGTGTGFYSVQLLHHQPLFQGTGIDISPASRSFTRRQVAAWGLEQRFTSSDHNIVENALEPRSCIQSIEVLEHFEDPQLFLAPLRQMLRPGGYGFVTAALTAPQADHLFLFWTADDVIQQLAEAGFRVEDYIEEAAYPAREDEIVPKVAAFIVS